MKNKLFHLFTAQNERKSQYQYVKIRKDERTNQISVINIIKHRSTTFFKHIKIQVRELYKGDEKNKEILSSA